MEHQAVTKATSPSTQGHSLQKQGVKTPAANNQIVSLQQAIGNQALQRLLRSQYIQAKLQVGPPNDHYEQEADRVADTVMRMPDPQYRSPATVSNRTYISRLYRKCTECEEEKVQRKPIEEENSEDEGPVIQRVCSECSSTVQRSPISADETQTAPSIVHEVMHSAGRPLDAATRAFMEPRFGRDFGGVRIHTDAKAAESAQAINARSYAVGGHLMFARGEYSPGTSGGMRLLAHELAHVVQQGRASEIPVRRTIADSARDFAIPDDQTISSFSRPYVTSVFKGGGSDEDERHRASPASFAGNGEVAEEPEQGRTFRISPSLAGHSLLQRTVTNLAVAGAPAEATVANHFISPLGGAVVITATTSAPGQAVTWTGGSPQPGNPLERRVSTTAARTTTVTADTPADPGSQTVDIHVVNGRAAPANVPAALSFSREPGIPPGFPPGPRVFGQTDVRVNDPTARIRAFVAGNQWAFQVERISHRFRLAVASTRIDIPSAASATQANHCLVIADMTPTGPTAPPINATFWSRSIVTAHENAHVTRFYSAPFWLGFMRTAETTIEAAASNVNVDHTVAATMSEAGVVAANAPAHQTILDTEHANADRAEAPGSEPFAHGVSNPMFVALVGQIAARFRPLAPTGLAAAATGPTAVRLVWVDNACNETGYRVYRRRGTGPFALIATLAAGTITFTDTTAGLAGNTDFGYVVTAFGGAGESARSNRADVHTP